MDTKTLLLIGAAYVGYKLLTKKKDSGSGKKPTVFDVVENMEFPNNPDVIDILANGGGRIDPSQFDPSQLEQGRMFYLT